MPINTHHIEYLTTHGHGRLATVSPNGSPQNKPVGYRYDPTRGTIDIAGFHMERSAKYRNVGTNPEVSFVIDDIVGEGPEGVRFVELRGRAEHAVDEDRATPGGVSAHIIRIHPRRLVSWNIEPGRDGMYVEDLAGSEQPPSERPALGYDELHAIHVRLKERGVGGPASRYEVVQTLSPTPGVAVAHVRRVALDSRGNPAGEGDATAGFSEMALYVLVRRGGTWWLAAGQNTPIRLSEAPSRN